MADKSVLHVIIDEKPVALVGFAHKKMPMAQLEKITAEDIRKEMETQGLATLVKGCLFHACNMTIIPPGLEAYIQMKDMVHQVEGKYAIKMKVITNTTPESPMDSSADLVAQQAPTAQEAITTPEPPMDNSADSVAQQVQAAAQEATMDDLSGDSTAQEDLDSITQEDHLDSDSSFNSAPLEDLLVSSANSPGPLESSAPPQEDLLEDNATPIKQVVPIENNTSPQELLCTLCNNLLTDAVVIPCCGNSFCDDCIRKSLLASEFEFESEKHTCPTCKKTGISPDSLVNNNLLRQAVINFKNKTDSTNAKKQEAVPNSTSARHTAKPQKLPTPAAGTSTSTTGLFPIFDSNKRTWNGFRKFKNDKVDAAKTPMEKEYRLFYNRCAQKKEMLGLSGQQFKEEVDRLWRKERSTITPTTSDTPTKQTPLLDRLPGLKQLLQPGKEAIVEGQLEKYDKDKSPENLQAVTSAIRKRHVVPGVRPKDIRSNLQLL